MTDATAKKTSNRALLLIDFQKDFLSEKARLPVHKRQIEPVLNAARNAIDRARNAGDHIVAIGNEFRRTDILMNILRRHASLSGSAGSQWVEDLPVQDAVYFKKWAGSAFVNPDLDPWLRAHGVQTLSLCGLKAKACITATTKDALANGYTVELITPAIACDTDESRLRALKSLQKRGALAIS